jgi:uncharacterized membrane protein
MGNGLGNLIILVGLFFMFAFVAIVIEGAYYIPHGWIYLIVSIIVLTVGIKVRNKSKKITDDRKFSKRVEKVVDDIDDDQESALEMLKKRYVSGEISEEEFNKIKKDLE